MSKDQKLFADGFGGYATPADAVAMGFWTSQIFESGSGGSGGTQTVGAFGRGGRPGLRFTMPNHVGIGFRNELVQTMPSNNGTIIAALAFRYSGPHFAPAEPFFSILDNSVAQVSLAINFDGTISVQTGDFGSGSPPTPLATSSVVVAANSYVQICIKAKIHGSTGTIDVWFNGASVPDITLTGQNTAPSGNNQWTSASLGLRWLSNLFSSSPAVTWDVSDFVMKDSSIALAGGVGATDPLGDVEVNWLEGVTSNGNYAEWTPLTGVNHGDMIKDAVPDDDGSYNEAAPTSGLRDTYFTSPLPTSGGTVLAVISEDVMKKGSIGTAQVTPFVRSAGVNTSGDVTHVLTDTYKRYRTVFIDFGGVTITPSLVNAMELGPEIA
jgi:hypothetical protein